MRCSRSVIVAVPLTTALAMLSCILFILSRGECPEGNFTCRGNRICILQRSVCDEILDCPEGEDEDRMYCSDLHGSFWTIADKYMGTRVPNDTCDLYLVPDVCKCIEYAVFCSRSNLIAVPTEISSEVRILVLDNNGIKVISDTDFHNFSLHFIHLGFNELVDMSNDVFKSQQELQKLYLMGNEIKTLPDSLIALPELKLLFLYENHLTNLRLSQWNMKALSWLDLSKNNISLNEEIFPNLPNLEILDLNYNAVTRIGPLTFAALTSLIDLSIGWNKIVHIDESAFTNLPHLTDLNLKNNLLVSLDGRLLLSQVHLEKLILGGNTEVEVTRALLEPLSNLKSLNVEGIEMPDINQEFFSGLLHLDFIYFKRFKYCMNVPQVLKCFPLSDGTSSSEDLLGNGLLRATLWVVSSFIVIANGVVVWRRLSSQQASTSSLNIIITNLAFADLLMGVYLMALGLEDFITRGNFRHVAMQWRSSLYCTVLGVIAMVSSEVSVLILLLISVERFMLISAPLSGFQSLKRKTALMTSSFIWVFALVIAILPAEWRHSMRFYGTNSFCFPLHIDEPYLVGWQYSALVFIGINAISLIAIATFYVGVFVSVLKTRNATTLNVNDSELAMRFFFIVLTNACCWVPIILLKILAFFNVNLSKDVYGWLGVFVLPVNSAVNPILYTFTTPRYKSSPPATLGWHSPDQPVQEAVTHVLWARAMNFVRRKSSGDAPRTSEEHF